LQALDKAFIFNKHGWVNEKGKAWKKQMLKKMEAKELEMRYVVVEWDVPREITTEEQEMTVVQSNEIIH
jgi:hypothetical protein